MCEFFGSRIEKEKENNNKNHQICQTNASIVNQVLHECNLQSVKTTLKKHQIRHLIIFLSSSILYVCCCLFDSNETNIGSDGKDAAITSYYNAFPAVRSAVCSSYSPKVPFTTRKTSSGYSDTVRGYGTKVQRRLHKKERKKERKEKKLHNKKREKPSCVQTSLMKTTRNPPSSSLQNSEAELAFCGDIILTPRFSSC